MYFFILIITLFFFAAQAGIATVFGHAGIFLISLYGLYYSSRYWLFWVLLVCVFFAAEPRFSFEYFILAAGLVGLALSPRWLALDEVKRQKLLLFAFALFAFGDFSHFNFSERGSLLIWLPVWLATLSSQSGILALSNLNDAASRLNKFSTFGAKQLQFAKYFLLEISSAILMFKSNKRTALLAYLSYLAQKGSRRQIMTILFLISIIVAVLLLGHKPSVSHLLEKINCPPALQQKTEKFIKTSIISRLYIWKSSFQGFLDAPLIGHGFGTFAIDFPVYRSRADVLGARVTEQVAHGHSVLFHFLFEQGLVGLALYLSLLVMIYKCVRRALLPFLVISLCDASLVNFNQYLLAALIFVPNFQQYCERNQNRVSLLSKYSEGFNALFALLGRSLPQRLMTWIIISVAAIFGSLSLAAHYFYERGNFSQAIKLDPYHSLYHFMQGASTIHLDPSISEYELKRAVELSPHVSYFYGFLAAAYLANTEDLSRESKDPRLKLASNAISKAILYDGKDAYWHTLSSFIHYQNPELSKREMELALKRNPEIDQLLHDPSETASEYIGSKRADVRLSGFYRRGPKVYLPLPYLE